MPECTPRIGWDCYLGFGHKPGRALVWYMFPGGCIKTQAYQTKRDNHDVTKQNGKEARAIAVGRIDTDMRKISIRTPLAPGNLFFMIPEAKLAFIASRLCEAYPGYEIWYFGNAATDIRRII